jgi:hypothetical protein
VEKERRGWKERTLHPVVDGDKTLFSSSPTLASLLSALQVFLLVYKTFYTRGEQISQITETNFTELSPS